MFEIFNETDKEIIEIDKLQKYMECCKKIRNRNSNI